MFGLSTGVIYSMYSSIFITGEYSNTKNSSNYFSEMTFNNSIIISFCCLFSLCYGLKNLSNHIFINYKLLFLFIPYIILGTKLGFLIGLYSNYQSNSELNLVILSILLIISTIYLYKR